MPQKTTVVIGRTIAEAYDYARQHRLSHDAILVGTGSHPNFVIGRIQGRLISRAYVTDTAHRGTQYIQVRELVERNMVRTGGAFYVHDEQGKPQRAV